MRAKQAIADSYDQTVEYQQLDNSYKAEIRRCDPLESSGDRVFDNLINETRMTLSKNCSTLQAEISRTMKWSAAQDDRWGKMQYEWDASTMQLKQQQKKAETQLLQEIAQAFSKGGFGSLAQDLQNGNLRKSNLGIEIPEMEPVLALGSQASTPTTSTHPLGSQSDLRPEDWFSEEGGGSPSPRSVTPPPGALGLSVTPPPPPTASPTTTTTDVSRVNNSVAGVTPQTTSSTKSLATGHPPTWANYTFGAPHEDEPKQSHTQPSTPSASSAHSGLMDIRLTTPSNKHTKKISPDGLLSEPIKSGRSSDAPLSPASTSKPHKHKKKEGRGDRVPKNGKIHFALNPPKRQPASPDTPSSTLGAAHSSLSAKPKPKPADPGKRTAATPPPSLSQPSPSTSAHQPVPAERASTPQLSASPSTGTKLAPIFKHHAHVERVLSRGPSFFEFTYMPPTEGADSPPPTIATIAATTTNNTSNGDLQTEGSILSSTASAANLVTHGFEVTAFTPSGTLTREDTFGERTETEIIIAAPRAGSPILSTTKGRKKKVSMHTAPEVCNIETPSPEARPPTNHEFPESTSGGSNTLLVPGEDNDPKYNATMLNRKNSMTPQQIETLYGQMKTEGSWWKTQDLLGSGGFGKVYKAVDLNTGKPMAAKVIVFDYTDSKIKQKLELLKREIQVMKELDHPNLVKYIKAETIGSLIYIFMEYVAGGTLTSAGKLPEKLVKKYSRDILDGLAYLHNKGVVHRDIKGDNILIGAEGQCKLADFGAANYLDTNPLESLKGTLNYMAPEVLQELGHNASADLWSFGCTVMQMLSGKMPFWYIGNQLRIVSEVGDENTPHMPLPPESAGFSPEATHFIKICIVKDPKNRATLQELLDHPWLASK